MIPRLKPYFGREELVAALKRQRNAVHAFEQGFAETLGAKYAVAFPYGRSALYALFKAFSIEGAEVIMPSYTCVVVPHAVVISGNIPKFVDITLKDYTMDLDLLEDAITPKTKVIIPTHLFGYPMDTDRVNEIVSRVGHKILIIQDCAHSFGATFHGNNVCNEGDAAIFGLNIAKYISSIFGGMLTTDDDEIYERVRQYRDNHFASPSSIKQQKKLVYLMAVYITFNKTFYGFVNFLEEHTPLLDRLAKYYRDDSIELPSDSNINMGDLEARVGEAQLGKYSEIKQRRQQIAKYYDEHLQGLDGLELPPIVDGATYSHYVPRVKNRREIMKRMRHEGVQLGQLIEYSIPHMEAYLKYKDGEFPNSYLFSQTTINLPNYPGLTEEDIANISQKLKRVINEGSYDYSNGT